MKIRNCPIESSEGGRFEKICPPLPLPAHGPKQSKADRHMEICDKLNEIYRAKNEAYGDSFGETYRKLGVISAITRMSDKMSRLTSLCTGAQNNVKDESIRDTALDLANYSIMLVMELDEEKRRGK